MVGSRTARGMVMWGRRGWFATVQGVAPCWMRSGGLLEAASALTILRRRGAGPGEGGADFNDELGDRKRAGGGVGPRPSSSLSSVAACGG